MLKSMARLEAVVGSRVGHFLLEHDCPVGLAKEMCNQFLSYLQNLEDQAKAQQDAQQAAQAQQPAEEAPKEAQNV